MARKGKSAAADEGPEELPPMLLEAIADAQADDAPRLVAADWFAEHGHPQRAELIALQCQLERLDPANPEREPLEAQQRALIKLVPPRWQPGLAKIELGWVRGFFGSAAGEAADLLAASPQLAELALPIEQLTLDPLTDLRALEKLVRTPFWAGLRALHLNGLDDLSASVLIESGKLGHLEQLFIEHASNLDRGSWALLAQGEVLPALRSLRLAYANAGHWLRASPALPALTLLSLENCALKNDDLKRLTRTPVWERLSTVGVLLTPLFAEGAEIFASAPPPAMKALDLSWCRLGAAGLRALASSDVLALEVLKLRHNALAGGALGPLVDAAATRKLEWLDVRGNVIDPRTLEKLKARFGSGLLF